MIVRVILITIIFIISSNLIAETFSNKSWVEFKSNPSQSFVTIFNGSKEIRTLKTPSKLKLPLGIYTLIYKKKRIYR